MLGFRNGVQHAIDCAPRPRRTRRQGRHRVHQLVGEAHYHQCRSDGLYQLNIGGAWSWNGSESWEQAVDLISRRVFDLDSLLRGHYTLDDWDKAFDSLRKKRDVKTLIYPNGLDWA